MKKKFVSLFTIIIAGLCAFSALGPDLRVWFSPPAIVRGQIGALHPGTIIWSVQECLAKATGAEMFTNGQGWYLFKAPMSNGDWALSFFADGHPGKHAALHILKSLGGQFNLWDATSFQDWLIQNGWSKIDPSQLPTGTRDTLLSLPALLKTASQSLIAQGITIIVVPVVDGVINPIGILCQDCPPPIKE
jgi:hypothetical protein